MGSAGVVRYGVLASAVALAASFGTPTAAGARLGFEFGANVSSLGYEHLDQFFFSPNWDPGWRVTPTGGMSLEFPLRRHASLRTGLRYVQQGNRVKVHLTNPTLTGEFRIAQHYLAVPLLVAFRPFQSRRLSFAAGPEGAVLLNGKMFTDYSPAGAGSPSASITHTLKRGNLSLDAETGLEFPAGRHSGIVVLRYTHGLVDAEKKNDWAVAWKTRGVEGLVGMLW